MFSSEPLAPAPSSDVASRDPFAPINHGVALIHAEQQGLGFAAVPDGSWTHVDPAYLKQRRLGVITTYGLQLILVGGFAWLVSGWWWLGASLAGVYLVVLVIRWIQMPKVAHSYAYAERGEDLLVTHGVKFKKLTVVPYGRMQVVRISSGPIQQHYGLSTVTLVTAAATTNATIPGLRHEEAMRLRDAITTRGEGKTAGL